MRNGSEIFAASLASFFIFIVFQSLVRSHFCRNAYSLFLSGGSLRTQLQSPFHNGQSNIHASMTILARKLGLHDYFSLASVQ